MTQQDLTTATHLLTSARRVACLTGAGISAESGVPTFRDAQTGLWSRFDAQTLASPQGFAADPGLVWRWYMWRLDLVERVRPNPGHLALAALADLVPSFTLITQNVDDLHEQAGSRDVLHLHGNIARFKCNRCGKPHALQPAERTDNNPPHCHHCGGLVRPDVVWFGEMLTQSVLTGAWQAVEHCDLLLVAGTSGMVYPAASLPGVAQAHGAKVIDINPASTPISHMADLFLQGPAGEILPALAKAVAEANP
ncbi:MAG: NAD-dependent deacylase [Caldilineaceae bacterium]|nr:NAD-dependent deacylase [Caldilineaceae bacterium]MBP8110130.1 NAD-dependent deacylase [Caldilineaceae bacterium]MBP8125530.1 NAD-dependent deacylase [Caldilineaceae bacterium]MBP9075078.1 NAD-dependent deacylase [Caldilineaceae bacterium]